MTDRIRRFVLIVALYCLTACASADAPRSLGDSLVHDIRCPNFEPWRMCVDKAEQQLCEGRSSRLVSPTAEELDRDRADGQTVPIEGSIRRRTIRIVCDAE